MKALLLFTVISFLSPFVLAQMVALPKETNQAMLKPNGPSDPESQNDRASAVRSLSSAECATDLQSYLDLNTVCGKLTLAGPMRDKLEKNGFGHGGFEIATDRSESKWEGMDKLKSTGQANYKNWQENDVTLVYTITHHLNSFKTAHLKITVRNH